jgi:hypothetical protein
MTDRHEQDQHVPQPQGASQQNQPPLFSQKSALTKLVPGSQPEQYQNSASTTNSGQRTSDRSSGPFSLGTQDSNGVRPGDHPDFSRLGPQSQSGCSSQLPDTQPQSSGSLPASQAESVPPFSSQAMVTPHRHGNRPSSINALLNVEEEDGDLDVPVRHHNQLIIDHERIRALHAELVKRSSGLSLEQLEQVRASMMDTIWKQRGNWNRNQVWAAVLKSFNETIQDIESCQAVLDPSQRYPH